MAAFQGGASVAKGLFPIIGAEGAASLRLLFAAVILIVGMRAWRSWPARGDRVSVLLLGMCMAGAILFFYLAISRLPQGVAIALQFLGPLTVAIGGSRRWRDLLWAALAGFGVWSLLGGAPAGRSMDPLGVLFSLLSAASWGSYILAGRRVTRTGGQAAGALALGVAALLLLPVGLWRAGPALFAPSHLPLAIAVGVLASAIPFPLELFALSRLPARTFAVLMSLEPALGAVSGFVLLGERLTLAQIGGVAAVVVAAAGATWASAATADPSAVVE